MESVQRWSAEAPGVVLALAALVFPVLLFVTAPYGRHHRPGWGPSMPARLGWLVMEAPSFFLFAALWWSNPASRAPLGLALGTLWLVHYGQRTFVFSWLMRSQGKPKPVITVVMAIVFNVLNASGNAVALVDRPLDAAFWGGSALFLVGMAVNLHADHVLRTLRGPGETGYRVPHGGLYRWVSAPNYLGELLEWVGFAIAAQTLAAWAFAAFTFANLAPRAAAHHRWYRARFPDYPPGRRALIPFAW